MRTMDETMEGIGSLAVGDESYKTQPRHLHCRTDGATTDQPQMKPPQLWQNLDMYNWLVSLHLPSELRGERFKGLTGAHFCRMAEDDFVHLDPENGRHIFAQFRSYLHQFQAPASIQKQQSHNAASSSYLLNTTDQSNFWQPVANQGQTNQQFFVQQGQGHRGVVQVQGNGQQQQQQGALEVHHHYGNKNTILIQQNRHVQPLQGQNLTDFAAFVDLSEFSMNIPPPPPLPSPLATSSSLVSLPASAYAQHLPSVPFLHHHQHAQPHHLQHHVPAATSSVMTSPPLSSRSSVCSNSSSGEVLSRSSSQLTEKSDVESLEIMNDEAVDWTLLSDQLMSSLSSFDGTPAPTPSPQSQPPTLPLTVTFTPQQTSQLTAAAAPVANAIIPTSVLTLCASQESGGSSCIGLKEEHDGDMSDDVTNSPSEADTPAEGISQDSGRIDKRRKRTKSNGGGDKSERLWMFLCELLCDPHNHDDLVRWENEGEGVFRIVKSEQVARMWGLRKNNQHMTYEKMSRSMRFCRSVGYFEEIPRDGTYAKKLIFKFGAKATDWRRLTTSSTFST